MAVSSGHLYIKFKFLLHMVIRYTKSIYSAHQTPPTIHPHNSDADIKPYMGRRRVRLNSIRCAQTVQSSWCSSLYIYRWMAKYREPATQTTQTFYLHYRRRGRVESLYVLDDTLWGGSFFRWQFSNGSWHANLADCGRQCGKGLIYCLCTVYSYMGSILDGKWKYI